VLALWVAPPFCNTQGHKYPNIPVPHNTSCHLRALGSGRVRPPPRIFLWLSWWVLWLTLWEAPPFCNNPRCHSPHMTVPRNTSFQNQYNDRLRPPAYILLVLALWEAPLFCIYPRVHHPHMTVLGNTVHCPQKGSCIFRPPAGIFQWYSWWVLVWLLFEAPPFCKPQRCHQ